MELIFDIDQLVKSMSADLGIHTKENSTQISTQTDTQTSTQTENNGTQKSEQKAFGEQKSEQNGISEQNGEQNDLSEQKTDESEQKTDRVYALIKNNPNVKRAEIAKALGISESAVQRLIKKLRDKNRIVRIGGDKGGHWQCND